MSGTGVVGALTETALLPAGSPVKVGLFVSGLGSRRNLLRA